MSGHSMASARRSSRGFEARRVVRSIRASMETCNRTCSKDSRNWRSHSKAQGDVRLQQGREITSRGSRSPAGNTCDWPQMPQSRIGDWAKSPIQVPRLVASRSVGENRSPFPLLSGGASVSKELPLFRWVQVVLKSPVYTTVEVIINNLP